MATRSEMTKIIDAGFKNASEKILRPVTGQKFGSFTKDVNPEELLISLQKELKKVFKDVNVNPVSEKKTFEKYTDIHGKTDGPGVKRWKLLWLGPYTTYKGNEKSLLLRISAVTYTKPYKNEIVVYHEILPTTSDELMNLWSYYD